MAWTGCPRRSGGPIKWKELHCRALAEFSAEKEDQWFWKFLEGLPCLRCRNHFETFLRDRPPTFGNHEQFFAWTVDAHNYVNRELGKKEVSLKEAYDFHRCEKDALEIPAE